MSANDAGRRVPGREGLAARLAHGVSDLINHPMALLQRLIGGERMAYVFLAPNLLFFSLFVFLPIGINLIYSVTGGIDLIVMIRVRSIDDVAGVVADRLNKVPGVLGTETHIAFRAYSSHDLEAAFSLGAG